MPSNVEIKASIASLSEFKKKAKELSRTEGEELIQEDVFFNVPNGRLKLRTIKDAKSELIFYDRPDQEGPKFSEFYTTPIEDPASFKETLGRAVGVKGILRKVRTLYMVGQTRVHVDQVEGLGDFMELEVQMQEGQSVEEGQKIADDLMGKLGVSKKDLISVAYMDLLLKKQSQAAQG
ncbi:adenylate cyclase CyaB-like [Saccostrea cucullata]|uniref:adenylate cyclase CyaB-like n=1 Tax=Saccostrea cuccullata TaxID=36930 RepID=UPI002ED2D8B7